MTPLTHPEARARLHHGRRWLDNKTAAALDAHLAECAECRAYAADLDALAPALAQALHARWDAVQPPRPRAHAAEETTVRSAPRRLSLAFTLVPIVLVLLLVVVVLPVFIAPPPATPAATEALAGQPSPMPPAALEHVLFAVDVGTYSGDMLTTTIQSPPRIIAWDPMSDRRLWETEVGLEPTLAVDPADGFLYVTSRPNAGLSTLTGHTFSLAALADHSADWPLRVAVLDPASGAVVQSFDLPATLDHVEPLGVVRGRLYLFRFGLGTLDTLELFSGYYSTGVALCGEGAHANQVQFAPDSSAVFALCWPIQVGTGAPFVRVLPLPAGAGQARTVALAPLSAPNGLLPSPDGRRLYVVDTQQGLIGEIDAAAGLLVRTSQYKGADREGQSQALLAFGPAGRRLYIATLGGPEVDRIRVVDTLSLELVEVLDPRPAVAQAMVAGPATLYVATDRGFGSAPIPGRHAITLSQALPASVEQLRPYPSAAPAASFDLPASYLEGLNPIAFEANRDGNSEIYLTNTGAAPRNLTQRPGPDRAPAWSPDGGYLAYLAGRGDRTDIMVLNVANALSTTDLVPPVRVHAGQPSVAFSDRLEWSPDGTQLAITTWPVNSGGPGEDGTVVLLDVAAALGGVDDPPPLLAIPGANSPRFSPDGTRLLYNGGEGEGSPWLFVHDLASGQRLNLTVEANGGFHWSHRGHAWSPDGKFIAYLRVRDDASGQAGAMRGEVVVAAADGSEHSVVTSLSPDNLGLAGLAYSPDGQTLLFVANQGNTGCWSLHLFSLASQTLSRPEGVCYYPLSAFPTWSPDGRFLLFTAGWVAGQPSVGIGGDQELTLLDVAQALANPAQVQPIRLTHWVGDNLSPTWRP